MKLYLLIESYPPEGCTVHGAFTTHEQAKKVRAEMISSGANANALDIEEIEADQKLEVPV